MATRAPLLLLIMLLATVWGRNADSGCSIDINTDMPKNEPIILVKKSSGTKGQGDEILALPAGDSGQVKLSKSEQLVLACPGNRNKLETIKGNASTVAATCKGGDSDELQVNQSSYAVKSLGCSRSVSGEIRSTGQRCGPRGAETLELGFRVKSNWLPLIEVCHEHARGNSLFSRHMLHGKQLKRAEKQSARPGFQVGGNFYPSFSPDVAYRKSVEKTTLTNILGRKEAEQIMNITFLARGHLAPDKDFILNPYQQLTYFYVNTAPQWQSVNAGNWLSLENTVRKIATDRSLDLDIITGIYGPLTLQSDGGKQKQIYLYSNKTTNLLPVAKYFWKVAYNKATQEGIAFVGLNNPFLNKVTLDEILCPNICEENGWLPKSGVWRKLSNGYLYCCEVNALRRKVSYIPKLDVKSILRGPG